MRKALIPLILLIVAMLAMPVFAWGSFAELTDTPRLVDNSLCPQSHSEARHWMPGGSWDKGCKFWCS